MAEGELRDEYLVRYHSLKKQADMRTITWGMVDVSVLTGGLRSEYKKFVKEIYKRTGEDTISDMDA